MNMIQAVLCSFNAVLLVLASSTFGAGVLFFDFKHFKSADARLKAPRTKPHQPLSV